MEPIRPVIIAGALLLASSASAFESALPQHARPMTVEAISILSSMPQPPAALAGTNLVSARLGTGWSEDALAYLDRRLPDDVSWRLTTALRAPETPQRKEEIARLAGLMRSSYDLAAKDAAEDVIRAAGEMRARYESGETSLYAFSLGSRNLRALGRLYGGKAEERAEALWRYRQEQAASRAGQIARELEQMGLSSRQMLPGLDSDVPITDRRPTLTLKEHIAAAVARGYDERRGLARKQWLTANIRGYSELLAERADKEPSLAIELRAQDFELALEQAAVEAFIHADSKDLRQDVIASLAEGVEIFPGGTEPRRLTAWLYDQMYGPEGQTFVAEFKAWLEYVSKEAAHPKTFYGAFLKELARRLLKRG